MEVLALTARRIHEERRRGADWGRRLALSSRSLLGRERLELGHRTRRTSRGARALLAAAGERLTRWIRDIPRAASVHVGRQQTYLESARRAVSQAARRDIATAGRRIEDLARAIRPRAEVVLTHEGERNRTRDRRLRLIDPRRVVERGYAILRLDGGTVLTHADAARAGESVHAELKHGSLRLLSEGPIEERGGN